MRTKKVYIIFIFILLLQSLITIVYWNKEIQNPEYEQKKALWSTLEGQASGRLVLKQDAPEIRQVFVNQQEQLNEVILFFYHCAEAGSGKVWVRIKDMQGNSYYEYSFEPLYMEQDTFCLGAKPDEGSCFAVGEKYYLEITVENMEAEDYVEVGTTLTPSKPFVFEEMQDGNTLFAKLDYTYMDLGVPQKLVGNMVGIWLAVDAVLVLLYLIIVKRYHKLSAVIVSAVAILVLMGMGVNKYVENRKWYHQNSFIAHALGAIDGKDYTNSREAFENAYQGGHKVFEVDFAMTSDGRIVLKHDWVSEHGLPEFEKDKAPTLEEFKNAKIWGKYTTMDIEDLLQLMLEYPDIYIVTDSKSSYYKDVITQFEQIAELLQGYSAGDREHIMEHFIVQIYNDDMYAGIESVADFDHYIYTLYQRGSDKLEELAEFCVENGIEVVTVPHSWWTREMNDLLHEYGLQVWVHTLNEEEEISRFLDNGVDGIYTDVADVK